jgi:quercetin dioxygenase-like cupin family protein
MGYTACSIDDVDRHELDDIEPDVLPVGVELRPAEMRPSVWAYEPGESSNRHYQEEQEELYVPLAGSFELELVEQDDDAVETVEIEPGDYLVVDPETTREVTAVTDAELLVVGAPNAKDDGVVVEG